MNPQKYLGFQKTFFGLFLLSALLLIAGCGQKTFIYKTMENKELGLFFEIPEGWDDHATAPGKGFVDFVINIPNDETEENRMKAKIAISKIDAPPGKLLNLEEEIGTFKNLFKDAKGMKIVSEKEVNMLNEKGKEILLNFQNREDAKVTEQVIGTVIIADNKLYFVLYDEEAAEFEKYFPVYEKLRDSLRKSAIKESKEASEKR